MRVFPFIISHEELTISIQIPVVLLIVLLLRVTLVVVERLIELHADGVTIPILFIVILDEFAILRASIFGFILPQSPPYPFIVIGSPIHPFVAFSVRVSLHESPQSRETVSHWRSDVLLTFANVCHAVAGLSPSLISLHPVALT